MKKLKETKKFIKIAAVIGVIISFVLSGLATAVNFVNENDLNSFVDKTSDSYEFSNKNEIIISYEMPDLIQTQINTELGIFTCLEIPGSGFIGEIGKPQLPYVTRLYAIPTTHVSFEILESHIAESRQVGKVYPAQKPHIDSDIAEEIEFIFDESFYKLDIAYPDDVVEITQEGKIRDIPFIKIAFYPVQYNPHTEIATIYDEITIKISWVSYEPLLVEHNFEQKPFYAFYGNVFINWGEFLEITEFVDSEQSSSGRLGGSGCEYLIITHPNFVTEAQELRDWKRERGIITKVVDIAETGTSAPQIRQYIQDAYDSWDSQPSYVLLVGDAEYVPTNYLYNHPYHGSLTASDMWYATVDGTDYYPDIFIGRLPVDTAYQAETIVQKILGYEKTPPTDVQFYRTSTVAAYFQDVENPPHSYQDGYEDRRFVRTSEEIRDYLLTQGYEIERIYCTEYDVNPTHYNNGYYGNGEPLPPDLLRPGFAWDGDYVDIINAINQGSIIVNHRDHGGTHAWGDPYFDTSHIASLSNGNLLPIVFSINCKTGWFDGEECFCEEFIEKSNGGTVGIFGATRVSYSGYNDYLCRGFYDAIWPNFDTGQGSNTPMYSMGQVLNYGKTYMANTWGDPWDYERVTFEMFHWFGDPTMEIWTDVPGDLVVDHPSEIHDSEAVTVTVYDDGENPVEGALVCISNDRLYGRGLTDENGVAIFEVNYATLDTKPLIGEGASLVVTAHNYIPYEATISADIAHPGDVNDDGVVNIEDLLLLLTAWGSNPDHPADFNGDDVVNIMDLLILLVNWG